MRSSRTGGTTSAELQQRRGINISEQATDNWDDKVAVERCEPSAPADYTALPRVTFTNPEVGSVGLTEAAVLAQGLFVATGTAATSASTRGFIHGPGNAVVIKLVVDTQRGVLVGATAAGPRGGEVLGTLALAVHARLTVDVLRTMIYAYPTFHRGVADALAALT